jgi:hypothetical protein
MDSVISYVIDPLYKVNLVLQTQFFVAYTITIGPDLWYLVATKNNRIGFEEGQKKKQ